MPNYTTYNIKMVKGDTQSFGFEIEGVENLDAAYFSCKRNSQDENYLFQKFLNSGITQRAESQYVVRIDPDDTALLEPGQYWYDLEISKNDDVFTIFRGVLELLPEITTPTGDINVTTSWGRIIGNINNQEDLQLEFQTKADVSSLSTVATTGLYSDLTGTPNLATVATSGAYSDLTGTPNLATVATSGLYSDLSGTPNLAAVATSGLATDLSGVLPLTNGGTGATNASDAKTNLGLNEVVLYESETGINYLNMLGGTLDLSGAIRVGFLYKMVSLDSSGISLYYPGFVFDVFPVVSGTQDYNLLIRGFKEDLSTIYYVLESFRMVKATNTAFTRIVKTLKIYSENGQLNLGEETGVLKKIYKIVKYTY